MFAKFALIITLFLSFTFISVQAQDFNSYRKQQRESFQENKDKAQEEWDAYRRNANAVFAEYLKRSWIQRTIEEPKQKPQKAPDVPPVVLPDIDIEIPEDTPIDVEINFPILYDEPIPIAPIPYKPKPAEKALSFVYYGTTDHVRFDIEKKVHLKGSDEKAVSRFWAEVSGEAYDNVVADCLGIRGDRDLCDWAYYKMTEKVSMTLYDYPNEQVVFHAWLLTQSGYSVRLGRENGNIHLLLGTTAIIFGKPYWSTQDGIFTLMDENCSTTMYLMDVKFPKTSPFRMRMGAENILDKNKAGARTLGSEKYPAAKVTVECDNNILSFLNDIPVSAIEGGEDTDFMKYADMQLSDGAGHEMYTTLFELIAGKTEAEAANIILNFVQTAFEYKTDGEVWGHERPFFPEETLYYPYCDCEDRAILFCRMIRDIMVLDVAFVSYPGHLAAAVSFTQDVSGDYFLVNGKKYVVCDPTFINAPVGRTMPGMDNKTARVYLMD